MIRKYATPPEAGTKVVAERVESDAHEKKVDDDSTDE